jgi:hypothetical protein
MDTRNTTNNKTKIVFWTEIFLRGKAADKIQNMENYKLIIFLV